VSAGALREWALRLNSIAFASPVKTRALLDVLKPEGLASSSDSDWAASAGVPVETASRWRRLALAFDVDGELRRLDALGGRLVVLGDGDYPALLAAVADAPLALYVQGRLAELPGVAIVGSRAPTAYGSRAARRLSSDLARRGAAVVSGLARGVDAAAHQAALEAGGATWAVLGSGLGEVYPPENRDLARLIVEKGGAILSEYPCPTAPAPALFPRRNRIVAALSWATVVVEGRANSGALLTAKNALDYGREVLAVPGPIDSPLSEAPLRLIRDGARLAASAEDILAALPPGQFLKSVSQVQAAAPPVLEADEERVMGVLGGESLSLEELGRQTGLDMGRLSLIMFGLEIKDLVTSAPGQRYGKKVF